MASTGRGFPDVELLERLVNCLGVSVDALLAGQDLLSAGDAIFTSGLRVFARPRRAAVSCSIGQIRMVCCGRPLEPIVPKAESETGRLSISRKGGCMAHRAAR